METENKTWLFIIIMMAIVLIIVLSPIIEKTKQKPEKSINTALKKILVHDHSLIYFSKTYLTKQSIPYFLSICIAFLFFINPVKRHKEPFK